MLLCLKRIASLKPQTSLILHLTVLSVSLLPVPVRHHQLAACLGLQSQERCDEHWEKVKEGERDITGRGQERCCSLEQSIPVPLQSH